MLDVSTQETQKNGIETDVPETKIPESKEFTLKGVVAVLVPTIMKCALGGYIISIPGKGIASFSTLEEAMDFLSVEGHDYMGEEIKLFKSPKAIERKADWHDIEEEKTWYRRLFEALGVRSA